MIVSMAPIDIFHQYLIKLLQHIEDIHTQYNAL